MSRVEDTCLNCGERVHISIFKGEHFCSGDCLRVLTNDTYDRALVKARYEELNPVKGSEKKKPSTTKGRRSKPSKAKDR